MTNTANYFRSLITLQTQTSLHAGILGGDHIIDRPIHRDVHTDVPKLSSNALKGAIKEQYSGNHDEQIFGTDQFVMENGESNTLSQRPKAGLVSFTDARLLFFPVKSKAGGWAWITCRNILKKWHQEASMALGKSGLESWVETLNDMLGDQEVIYAGTKLKIGNHLVFYRHKLAIDKRLEVAEYKDWAKDLEVLTGIKGLAERLAIVSNENFQTFTKLYTETVTRNKINDETKAVAGGALFTEEYLPANAVLYAMAFSMPNATQKDIEDKLGDNASKTIQIGGNATIGKGICKLTWHFPKTEKINA